MDYEPLIKALYQRILGRSAYPSEINRLHELLKSGDWSVDKFIYELMVSDELTHKMCQLKPAWSLADTLYRMLLGRPVEDDKARSYLATNIVKVGWPKAVQEIMSSDEYRSRARNVIKSMGLLERDEGHETGKII